MVDKDTEIVVSAEDFAGASIDALPHVGGFVKLLFQKHRDRELQRILRLLEEIGHEINRGQSETDWKDFEKKIDDDKYYAVLMDAVREALQVYDEAAIPYLARAVALFLAETKSGSRRNIRNQLRFFAELDSELLTTLTDFVTQTLQQLPEGWESTTIIQRKYNDTFIVVPRTVNEPESERAWKTQYCYAELFEILKVNNLGREGDPGMPALDGQTPSLINVNGRDIILLNRICSPVSTR